MLFIWDFTLYVNCFQCLLSLFQVFFGSSACFKLSIIHSFHSFLNRQPPFSPNVVKRKEREKFIYINCFNVQTNMDSVGHYGSYIYNDDHHHFALHFVHEVRKKKKRTDSNCRFHPIVGSGLMVLSEHGFSSMMIIKKKKKKGKLVSNRERNWHGVIIIGFDDDPFGQWLLFFLEKCQCNFLWILFKH